MPDHRPPTDRPTARPADRYGRDVLADRGPGRGPRRPEPQVVPATADVVAEDPLSGFCGAVVAVTSSAVTLEDRRGNRRMFPLEPGAFLVDGRPTTLVRPAAAPTGPARSASGSRQVAGVRARTAQASRIWVEGVHDAALVERVWGHDLRVEGIVVEPLDGLDHLAAAVAEFAPRPDRRLGVLVDHLVPGSKEDRITREVTARVERSAPDSLLVTGHPFIDIWQAVRPSAVGIRAWPEVPRGVDWKTGVCRALGVPDTRTMWGRVNGAVRTYRDLDTPVITAMEQLIDFVTAAR
ncbi:DUF3097 domain-containing protein [Nakamurella flava]|uniref:DUF3097 domain-containing protein n=1 Tax=Nakamurella flava TaxID=2576308 RepID=A0A4U6QKS6_9ACTN|nr:DUF3097 domain-containing protein [Nakamurella flava]TKV60722.1 DUF3097 domain-containing protein [Nakamurella flava]